MKAALENEYYSTLDEMVAQVAGQTITVDQACDFEARSWARLGALKHTIDDLDVNDLDRLAAIYARHGVYIA